MAQSLNFRCGCCGKPFHSDKPQDPERDKGYGSCEACRPHLIADMVRFGFACRDWTEETARKRMARYA